MQPGRVELDPMRIPVAASMQRGQQERFDRVLRESIDADDARPTPERGAPEAVVEDVDDAIAAVDAPVEPRAEPDDAPAAEPGPAARRDVLADADADVTENIRRGETAQSHEAAGKGTGSPRISPDRGAPELAAAPQSPDHAPDGAPFVLAATAQPSASNPAAAGRTGDPAVRGASLVDQTTTARAKAAQAGYGARSPATLRMLEQARDSVFKQILMKLDGERSEMRMTLQPPELGQLDLRLSLEHGNKLTLAIAAERADLNQLLLRHLDELKQTLQQNGLEISGAEVQTREEFTRRQQQRERGDGEAAPDAGATARETTDHRPTGGYLTADGLDFWA